jgi:hypothetical protein
MEKFVSTVKVGINQSGFNKVGHLLVCKQSKRFGSPNFFILCDVNHKKQYLFTF